MLRVEVLTMEQFEQSGSVVDFQIYKCNCDVHILHQNLLDYKGHIRMGS